MPFIWEHIQGHNRDDTLNTGPYRVLGPWLPDDAIDESTYLLVDGPESKECAKDLKARKKKLAKKRKK